MKKYSLNLSIYLRIMSTPLPSVLDMGGARRFVSISKKKRILQFKKERLGIAGGAAGAEMGQSLLNTLHYT